MKIKSPVSGFTGRTFLGSTALDFEDGVAEAPDLTDGQKAYLRGAGYGLGSASPTVADPVEVPDPRDFDTPTQVGARTRDAAVDPRPEDFLAPTNAGEANPHGPDVVSPQVHASEGVRPVKPGDVHVDDLDAQDEAETEHAEVHTSGEPVIDAEGADGETVTDAERAAQPAVADAGDKDASEGARTMGELDSDVGELKGKALDAALEEAGLSKSGTADEKRARLAEAGA